MAKFSETLICTTVIAVALLITNIRCFPTRVEAETENEGDTDVISLNSDDTDPAPSATNGEVDSNCDCEDGEAMFHKLIRQLIDSNQLKNKDDFLKQFPIKKVCGSDGKYYNTDCELQCTRIKVSGQENLTRVGRRACRVKGRAMKAEFSKKGGKSIRKGPYEMVARMQRPANDPETLVCICPRNYFPICASNGVTYGNRCAFECAKGNVDPDLTVVKLGFKCEEDDKTFV